MYVSLQTSHWGAQSMFALPEIAQCTVLPNINIPDSAIQIWTFSFILQVEEFLKIV